MDESFIKVLFGLLAGGVGKTLIDFAIKYKSYKAGVLKSEIENDALASVEWKKLYDELKMVQQAQATKIDLLELECEKLRLKNIDLQHQISFGLKN